MKILTCSVCGIPLGSEDVRRCSMCSRYICRDHIRYIPTKGWICTTCIREMTPKKEPLISVAYIDL